MEPHSMINPSDSEEALFLCCIANVYEGKDFRCSASGLDSDCLGLGRMTLANEIHKDALNEGWSAILRAMADQ